MYAYIFAFSVCMHKYITYIYICVTIYIHVYM